MIPPAVMILALFASLGRGAMLGFFVSVLFFIGLLFAKKNTRGKAILLVSVLIIGAVLMFAFTGDNVKDRVATLKDPLATASAETRLSIWRDTFNVFKAFPVFGTGLNTFEVAFPGYKTIYGSGKMYFTHAENDYVEALSEVGVLGGVVLLLMLLFSFGKFFDNFTRSHHYLETVLLAGSISSVLATLVCGLTDFVFHLPAISLSFVAVCFMAFPAKGKEGKLAICQYINRKGYVSVIFILLTLSIFLLAFSSKVFLGQAFFYKYLHAKGGFKTEKEFLERAIAFDGKNADYSYELGKLYFQEGKSATKSDKEKAILLIKEAHRDFANAVNLSPTNWKYHFFKGASELILATEGISGFSTSDAEESFNRALKLNPTEYEVYLYLANYYLPLNPDLALEYYSELLRLHPYRIKEVLSHIWKFSNNPRFLEKAIPDDPKLLLKYADFLKSKGLAREAETVTIRAQRIEEKWNL
jgi:hypothetical protein